MPRDAWKPGPRRRSRPGRAAPARPPPYAESVPSRRQGQGSEPSQRIPISTDRRDQRAPPASGLAATSSGRSSTAAAAASSIGAIVIAESQQGQPLRQIVGRQPLAYVEHAATLGHGLGVPPATASDHTGSGERDPARACRTGRPPSRDAFKAFIAEGLGAVPDRAARPRCPPRARPPGATPVSAVFPGERLVIPAGGLKVRSNDTDYRFRPHSAFAHLTGLGADREPDAVLVLRADRRRRPRRRSSYFRPRAPPGHRGVLLRRPLRRDVGRAPADPGGDRGRAGGIALRHHRRAPSDLAKNAGDADRACRARRRRRRSPPGWTRLAPRRPSRAEARQAPGRRAGRGAVASCDWSRTRTRSSRCALACAEHRRGLRGRRRATCPRPSRTRPRRALGRGRLRAARPPRRQRRRLRHHRRLRRPRQHAALDPQRRRHARRATCCCSTPASRSTRSTPPTSPARCRSTARSPTSSARSTRRCWTPQEAGIAAAKPGAKFRDVHDGRDRGHRRAPAGVGPAAGRPPRRP